MMLKRLSLGMTAALLAASALPATAESDYGRSGIYVGASALYSIENFNDTAGINDSENSWGYDAKVGYRINKRWAVEAEWEHATGYDLGAGAELDEALLTANTRVYLGTGQTQVYLLGGVGYAMGDISGPGGDDDSAFVMHLGLGVDRYITENWAITGEFGYVIPTGELQSTDSLPITLGVLYRFS